MVDIMEPGLTQGNLLVTIGVVSVLILISEKYKVLDRTGVYAAAALGITVGAFRPLDLVNHSSRIFGNRTQSNEVEVRREDGKRAAESSDGHRSWGNVVANGGLPGLVTIIAFLLDDHQNGLWLFSPAVSVAAADTFASEIGCLDNRVQ